MFSKTSLMADSRSKLSSRQLLVFVFFICLPIKVVLSKNAATSSEEYSSTYKLNTISKRYNYNGQNQPCEEKLSLEVRTQNAVAIFTGTIRDLQPDHKRPGQQLATVKVKRIIKGMHVLSQTLQDSSSDNDIMQVKIGGIGNPDFCQSKARKLDTRIMMVGRGEDGELRLNSSFVRITLSNIELCEKAVKENGMKSERERKIHKDGVHHTKPVLTTTLSPDLPPEITSGPKDQKVVEDQAVSFICEASGTPMPMIHWEKSGSRMVTDKNVIIATTPKVSVLRINAIGSKDDGATIECIAENENGRTSIASANLKVYLKDSVPAGFPTITDTSKEETVTKNHTAIIACRAAGNPKPSMTWFKNYIPIDFSKEKYNLFPNGSLQIFHVSESDDGKYECVVENRIGSATSSFVNLFVKVQIRSSPQFSIRSTGITVNPGESVNLTCQAFGFPIPSISWTTKGDVDLNHPVLEEIGEEEGFPSRKSILILQKVEKSAIYKCTAKSELGTIDHDTEVQVAEDLCKHRNCKYGATCVIDAATGGAGCRCLHDCSDAEDDPVCGSDEVTYTNECSMRAAACMSRRVLVVQSHGECGGEDDTTTTTTTNKPQMIKSTGGHSTTSTTGHVDQPGTTEEIETDPIDDLFSWLMATPPPANESKDPCSEKVCDFGAQCVSSIDGLTARCQCPVKCDNFGDSVGSDEVCGSDAETYTNECEMKKMACNELIEIEKKYDGKCDPCHDHECPTGQVCHLDNDRKPVCRCDSICSMVFDPVCGSDGKTYVNECIMKIDGCRRGLDLRPIFHSECSSGDNPCDKTICKDGEHCHVDEFGTPQCTCPPECDPVFRPVCSHDGKTYDSECHMHRTACLNKQKLTLWHDGICKVSPCHEVICHHGATCLLQRGQPVCVCPTCTEVYDPVCGSDDRSYYNECKLKQEMCTSKFSITVAHKGLCNVCKNIKCEYYAKCVVTNTGEENVGKCECPSMCDMGAGEVCGSDGNTYPNECDMRLRACLSRQMVTVAYRQPCDSCFNVKCDFGSTCKSGKCVCENHCPKNLDPICGSDDQTYSNQCMMRMKACTSQKEIVVQYHGRCKEDEFSGSGADSPFPIAAESRMCDAKSCKYGGVCGVGKDGAYGCICQFNCGALRSPVCGSDGKSYANECEMKEESCRKQTQLTVATSANCEEDIVEELCDGQSPLVNNLTKTEYNCTNDKCPAGSYCHKLGSIAKCCSEDSCQDSRFGCCSDKLTAALGPNFAGCPNNCKCNPLGSKSLSCDPVTQQCPCKPGVIGQRCDRCNSTYWGLPKINEGNDGCIPCNCNKFGSARNDCEQMTGRCVCLSGIQGQKCDTCPNGKHLGPKGCTDMMLNDHLSQAKHCLVRGCNHGAVCQLRNGIPQCICPTGCAGNDDWSGIVCGSDGRVYGSLCQLKSFACQQQRAITVSKFGYCLDDATGTTTVVPDNEGHSFITMINSQQQAMDEGGRSFVVPSFSGHSYLKVRKQDYGSRDISIKIEFRTQKEDGILLYIGQSADGKGDFLSIALKNGYVEFRYDLGSGASLIRSTERVKRDTWHKVAVTRFGRDGVLVLDDGHLTSGSSNGQLKSLNLATSIYLGFIENFTDNIRKNIGVGVGFVGCIQSLSINSSDLNYKFNLNGARSSDIESAVNIVDCQKFPCWSFPCLNGGHCIDLNATEFKCKCRKTYTGIFCQFLDAPSSCDPNPCSPGGECTALADGGFTCDCSTGYEGLRCEIVSRSVEETPGILFDGLTHHMYQNQISYLDKSQTYNKFEIAFRAESNNGLLLLLHKSTSVAADYLAIVVREGYVEASFNLGKESQSKPLYMTSHINVTDGLCHTLVFTRTRRHAKLSVDDRLPTKTAIAMNGATSLDTDGYLSIGGSRVQLKGLPEAYKTGFIGCVNHLRIDDRNVDMIKDRDEHGAIAYCDTRCDSRRL